MTLAPAASEAEPPPPAAAAASEADDSAAADAPATAVGGLPEPKPPRPARTPRSPRAEASSTSGTPRRRRKLEPIVPTPRKQRDGRTLPVSMEARVGLRRRPAQPPGRLGFGGARPLLYFPGTPRAGPALVAPLPHAAAALERLGGGGKSGLPAAEADAPNGQPYALQTAAIFGQAPGGEQSPSSGARLTGLKASQLYGPYQPPSPRLTTGGDVDPTPTPGPAWLPQGAADAAAGGASVEAVRVMRAQRRALEAAISERLESYGLSPW